MAVLSLAVFAPMIWLQMREGSDYSYHIQFARKMLETRRPPTPHFLFQVLVIGLAKILALIPLTFAPSVGSGDFNLKFSAFLTVVLSVVALEAFLYSLMWKTLELDSLPKRLLISLFGALSLALIAPVNLFSAKSGHLYLGYVGLNVYHNPTILLLKPMALFLFFSVIRFLTDPISKGGLSVLGLAVVSVLCLLAKPSYTICLLPVLAAFLAFSFLRGERRSLVPLFFGFIFPSVAVLAWQYHFTFTTPSIGEEGILFAPFRVVRIYSSWIFPKFILSILFPAYVYLFYRRAAVKELALNLAWCVFGVGAFYQYFLAEAGQVMGTANFFWSAQVSLFILFVVSVQFFIRKNLDLLRHPAMPGKRNEFVWGATLFGLHLAGGIVWYYKNLRPEAMW